MHELLVIVLKLDYTAELIRFFSLIFVEQTEVFIYIPFIGATMMGIISMYYLFLCMYSVCKLIVLCVLVSGCEWIQFQNLICVCQKIGGGYKKNDIVCRFLSSLHILYLDSHFLTYSILIYFLLSGVYTYSLVSD